jgi:hypothetical protein
MPETNRPTCKAAQAVRTLLQEIRLDESENDTSEELGLTTAVEESQAEAGFADDDDDGDEDLYDELEAVVDPEDEDLELSIDQFALEQLEQLKKPSQAVPVKKAKRATKDLSSDESSDEQGMYSFFAVISSDVLGSQLHVQCRNS